MGGWSKNKTPETPPTFAHVDGLDLEKALEGRRVEADDLGERKVAVEESEAGDSVSGEETVPRSFLGGEEERGLCIVTVTNVNPKLPERTLQKG